MPNTVSQRALISRINRHYAGSSCIALHKARSGGVMEIEYGPYYTMDHERNMVIHTFSGLQAIEELGRELHVLNPHEDVAC